MGVGTLKHLRPCRDYYSSAFSSTSEASSSESSATCSDSSAVIATSSATSFCGGVGCRFSFVVVRYTFGFVGFNFGLSSLLFADFFAEGVDLALDIALGLIVSGVKRFGYFLGIVRDNALP